MGHSSAAPSPPVVNSLEAASLVAAPSGTKSLAELRAELVKHQGKAYQLAKILNR